MLPGRDDRSLVDLVGDLLREVAALVRQELALARVEIGAKLGEFGLATALLALGAAAAFAGLLVLLNALVLQLSRWMDPALAALLVGGVVALIGIALLWKGIGDLKARNLMPRRTAENVRRNAEFVREKVS